jgi:hypothetical protein
MAQSSIMTFFETTRNGVTINFSALHTETLNMALPLVGDDIELPKEVVLNAEYTDQVFHIVKRRFLYQASDIGISVVLVLILSQD